ncbi:hypothetical protein N474_09505 [Pseudoalteromonas luteoviolacea CPMOR-2]|uniref:hypothetical protein n=1 Tax=Pseudoalteromonas luteoviolacea TaxID=43657 RepID=UPI0007B0960F|nr:hypothetical protein [Pseudoalteromonas luteoviolacea]KZN56846.1 hypothetical protein N474_09505 [Pseudoalteromonas luteoviolacea CPMOR-2]
MLSTGFMNFFKVDKCGLYKVGDSNSNGCELGETFDLIMQWVEGRPLALTIPWDPKEKPNKSKCYCKDIYKDDSTGDFVIVLWKSDTDNAGTLWGASEDNATGSKEVVKYTNTYKGKKVIWGRPCYYWVIPRFNTIVSIKFEHSVCDSQLFEDYVGSCIRNRVQHPNRIKEHTPAGHVRLSLEHSGYKFNYSFKVSLKSINTSESKLNAIARNITHIIRRETVLVNAEDARADWVKKFSEHVPYLSAKPKSKSRKIEIRAEAKPTKSEIKEIIEKNAKENRKAHEWDNVGFETDTGTTWVDTYRLKDVIHLPNKKDEYLTAKDLLVELSKNMSRYIRPLKEEAESSSREEVDTSKEGIEQEA